MRQFMQSMVTFAMLMLPAISTTATTLCGYTSSDTVAVEKEKATAETRTITGTVYDAATNTPLPGVRVQGTGHLRVTTMTDADGNYKLNVPKYVTLLSFSTPEYGMVQRAVAGKDVINVRLYTENFTSTYNDDIKVIASNGFDVEVSPSLTIDSDIQNKLGADIRTIMRSGTPGIGAAMFIRGINSLNANTQPLVVVDGLILDTQENSSALHLGAYNNILSAIDMQDIESVEVMKNGTAIYGTRAANGVILINTKRGKSMATRITANIYGSVTLQPTLPDVMNAEQYRTYANELIGTIKNGNNSQTTQYPFLQSNKDYYYYNLYHNNTDWASYIYREAIGQNYKVNVEGGDDVAMYNFSLGYSDAESTLEKNSFNRLNIRFNSDIVFSDNLKTRFDISYSRVARELLDDGIGADFTSYPVSAPGFIAMVKSPFLSPYKFDMYGNPTSTYDTSDTYALNVYTGSSYNNNSLYNPMTILSVGAGDNKNEQEYTHFGITVAPELTLGKFKITEVFNYSLHRMNEKYYLPYATPNTDQQFYAENLGRIGNWISSSFGKEAQVTSDTQVRWNKVMGAHSLNVLLGFRYTNFSFDNNFLEAANSGNDKAVNISADYDYVTNTGDDNVWANLAWYGHLAYNYKTRYFIEASASMETSSRFGKNADGGIKLGGVKWGIFPSVQAAWLLSSESWFNVKPINSLKLRAGYDVTGNDAIDFYAARSYLETVKYQGDKMGIQIGNVENDGVKWESTSRFNVGLDAVLFNDRIGFSFDWYKSKTTDMLVPKAYDFVAGMNTYWSNSGEMENTGFEVALTAKVINTANFQWELGASVGHYENEITSLDEQIEPTKVYGAEVLTQVGSPVGVFYGYKTQGVITSSEQAAELQLYQKDATGAKEYFQAGDIRFVDIDQTDGVGCISDADKTIIGDPNPDFYGNIFTKFTYKNWQLNVGLNYSVGNDVYNYYRQQLESGSNFFNQTTAMLNRWSLDGMQTSTPRAVYGDPMGNARFSDRWIEDGSYLKLKNVQLSYKVPVSTSWLQGITVWCAAENLLTLTKYLGNDPETSISNNVLYQGVDAGWLPQSRSFHLGVKVNL